MNLLQVPLDIQLVSKFQSLSVAYTARFSQRKDKQFPSHTTIFSSKKYQNLSPRHHSEELGNQNTPNTFPMGSDTVSSPSRSSHQMPTSMSVGMNGLSLFGTFTIACGCCCEFPTHPRGSTLSFQTFLWFREVRFLRKIRLMPVEEDRSSWVGLWTFLKVWCWFFHVRFLEKFLEKMSEKDW